MHIRTISALVCILALLPLSARADDTDNKAETEAVLASFRKYNDAMMALDEKPMAELQYTTNEGQERISAAMIQNDLAVARLKLAAQEKFAGEAGKRVGKAIGDISNDDLAHARVDFKGNMARISGIGGDGIVMIKDKDAWKFDLSGLGELDEQQIQRQIANHRARAARTDALTEEIKAGKYESIEELVAEIPRRMN